MDDDTLTAILVLGAIGALWFLARRNSQPLTFDPSAPDPLDNVISITPRTTSSAEITTIETEEGFQATPYGDAGKQDIGYGHQIQTGENYTDVTQTQGVEILQSDLAKIEQAINTSVKVPINQNQFDALANYIYNVGIGAFQSSTLLIKLNAGDYSGASAEFVKWVNSDGQVSAVLQQREASNQTLFNN